MSLSDLVFLVILEPVSASLITLKENDLIFLFRSYEKDLCRSWVF